MTISLCMIVKDEEKNLNNCLKKIKDFIDEIIIIDTGSTDKTKDIAKQFTNKIYNFKWDNDFSKARNFSISKATKDWILILDADETIAETDLKKLKNLTKDETITAYKFTQRNYSNKKTKIKWKDSKNDIYKESKNFKGWKYRGIIRLFQNKKNIKFIYPIHETVLNSINEKIANSEIPIHHIKTKENTQLYYKLLKNKIKESPTSHSFAELAIHCFENKKRKEGEEYREQAIKLNKDLKFLNKL